VNQPTSRWRTDDPCPVCGTGLNCTDVGDVTVAQDCPLCGWSATWQVPRVVLSATQSDCLRDMLADAITYRRSGTGQCPVCRGHLAEDCAEHSPAWSLVESYRSLVHDLDGGRA
jgi:hypothetical protein